MHEVGCPPENDDHNMHDPLLPGARFAPFLEGALLAAWAEGIDLAAILQNNETTPCRPQQVFRTVYIRPPNYDGLTRSLHSLKILRFNALQNSK
jgi:hypothetical protein